MANIELQMQMMAAVKKAAKKYAADDWDSVRNQAAIAALNGWLSDPYAKAISYDEVAEKCVLFADALIDKLKTTRK